MNDTSEPFEGPRLSRYLTPADNANCKIPKADDLSTPLPEETEQPTDVHAHFVEGKIHLPWKRAAVVMVQIANRMTHSPHKPLETIDLELPSVAPEEIFRD